MHWHFTRLAMICAIANVVVWDVADAGLVGYGTKKTVSDDGKFILVRIDPERTLDEELDYDSLDASDVAEIREIRTRYPKSGLYANNESNNALWTYNGRWCAAGPLIAPDGCHVIFLDRYTSGDFVSHSVEFMARGVSLRRYGEDDLIPQYLIKSVLNGFSPPSWVDAFFDSQRLTFTIRTNQAEEFVLDVTTGEIISVRSPFRTVYAAAGVILVLAIALPAGLWLKKKRRSVVEIPK